MRYIIAVVLLFVATAALAHGWYDHACCSDRDCFPIKADTVTEEPGGWRLKSGEFIERGNQKQSQDEDYHLCRVNGTGAVLCLYVPSRGS